VKVTKVNMNEAETNFSMLVELALQGEEVIVARNGEAVVKLVPVAVPARLRPIGLHRQPVGERFAAEALRPLEPDEAVLWYNPELPGR